jgi:acyl-CoA thioester hydrolase
MTRVQAASRDSFFHYTAITTRWSDNDAYGHVNNVIYYSWFDSAVNSYLIKAGALDIEHSPVIGLVVHTQCHYFSPLAFPQQVEAGIAVAELGRSSVRYRVGLFASGEALSAAHGDFVHVYVDRQTRRPVHLPDALRQALLPLVVTVLPGAASH